jgi:hypothetical protein
MGYGFGVPFRYYSLIYESTRETTFVHNGYVGLLYRHGLIGTGLLMFAYAGSALSGLRLYRAQVGSEWHRVLGLAAVAALSAEALVALSGNPFAVSDKTLIIACTCALAVGSADAVRREAVCSDLDGAAE